MRVKGKFECKVTDNFSVFNETMTIFNIFFNNKEMGRDYEVQGGKIDLFQLIILYFRIVFCIKFR